jgi:hypothetical protein
MASLVLDYAENERRKRRAGILSSEYKPEGPHNTAAVLSANEVYHILLENAEEFEKRWGLGLFANREDSPGSGSDNRPFTGQNASAATRFTPPLTAGTVD